MLVANGLRRRSWARPALPAQRPCQQPARQPGGGSGHGQRVSGAGLNGCRWGYRQPPPRPLAAGQRREPVVHGAAQASPVHRKYPASTSQRGATLLQNKGVGERDRPEPRAHTAASRQYNQPAMAKLSCRRACRWTPTTRRDRCGYCAAAWRKKVAASSTTRACSSELRNRATKMYKVMEYELAINIQKAFAMLDEVNPTPSATNCATLYYNWCPRLSNQYIPSPSAVRSVETQTRLHFRAGSAPNPTHASQLEVRGR